MFALEEYHNARGCWLPSPARSMLAMDGSVSSTFATQLSLGHFAVPVDRVVHFQLNGHSDAEIHKIDTHDQPICEEVWSLYDEACQRFGSISTMIERDSNVRPFDEIVGELEGTRSIATTASHAMDELAA